MIALSAALFDEEFQALKNRISAVEEQLEEEKNDKEVIQKDVLDLKIKMSNILFKEDNEDSLTEEQINTLNKLGLQITGRSCEELFQYGLKQSGTFPVDPDGDDYGYPPIDVHCDYESKSDYS